MAGTSGRRRSRLRWLPVLAVTAVVTVVAAGCGERGVAVSTPPAALPDIDALRCPATATVAARPSSLPTLLRVAAEEKVALHGHIVPSGHGRSGAEPPIAVTDETRATLANELRSAALVACELRTTDDAARAGYVMSSYFTQGVGTHWTNWDLIDAPFDPTRPAMLLYAPRQGRTELIGFSFWVRTPNPRGPEGFAGPADVWHRHYGMCFARSGLLQREDVRSPALCEPGEVYVNGQDMWMLHAWVVPGAANVWGPFAALNPQLCSRSVPDIERCPGLGGP